MKVCTKQHGEVAGESWAVFQPNRKRVQLLRLIRKSLQANQPPLGQPVQTGRANHCIQFLEHEGEHFILKYFSTPDTLSWNRKIELTMKEIIRSGARRSYLGARYLWDAGIPTAKPLGYVAEGCLPWKRVSVFVSDKIDADGNIQDIIATEKKLSRLRKKMLALMATITRRMHDQGYRHTDIVPHNFLVKDPQSERPEVFLIDTDKVHPARFTRPIRILKHFWDLRCLRRLKNSREELEWILQNYFGRQYRPAWLTAHTFWRRGGFNLFRHHKLALKQRKQALITPLTLLDDIAMLADDIPALIRLAGI